MFVKKKDILQLLVPKKVKAEEGDNKQNPVNLVVQTLIMIIPTMVLKKKVMASVTAASVVAVGTQISRQAVRKILKGFLKEISYLLYL